MSKLKTHRGAAKRFSITKGGKVKINRANRRHILAKHSTKYKRGLRKQGYASDADAPIIKKLIPYA